MNTGIQRSLTISVTKKISDIVQPGYPIIYQGRNAFNYLESSYPTITYDQMADLTNEEYNTRLTAFKLYVQNLEAGLNIDVIQSNVPFLENTTSCPIS
ncbi:MAG: hypothetical protein VB066_01805 [Paludibacter sp.]|nr:hypothetical protein [Paludibacter sp.]